MYKKKSTPPDDNVCRIQKKSNISEIFPLLKFFLLLNLGNTEFVTVISILYAFKSSDQYMKEKQ